MTPFVGGYTQIVILGPKGVQKGVIWDPNPEAKRAKINRAGGYNFVHLIFSVFGSLLRSKTGPQI